MFLSTGALALGAALVFFFGAFTPNSAFQAKKPNKYVGVSKCKNCHSAEETGNQHGAWMKMKHAKAFETLGSEESKKLGAAKGIADPQTADACLKCHVTGFGEPAESLGKGFEKDRKFGVHCESCHGPGEAHVKARMAAAATAVEGEPVVLGADELMRPDAKTCTGCHNSESPSYKPFCYFKFREETKHLNPKAKRSEEDQKRLDMVCGCGDKCPTDKCATGECGVPKSK